MSSVNLPDEILLYIFRYLPVKELLPLRLVNRQWKRVASDSSMYTVINVNEYDSASMIVALLRQQKDSIHHIHITERIDFQIFVPFIIKCSNLRTLCVKWCNSYDKDLSKIIECNKNLDTIILQYCTYTSKLDNFFVALAKSRVKNINICNLNHDIETNQLANLRNIEDLRIKSVGLEPREAYKFCLNNFDCLTTLKLRHNGSQFPVELKKKFFEAVGRCERLKKLCLGPHVTFVMTDFEFSHLMKLNNLSVFEIHYAPDVSESSFVAFFARPSATKLRKINLFRCPAVNNTVLRQISERCHNLEKCSLEKTKNTNSAKDVDDVITFVASCKKLQKLNLFSAHISVSEVLHQMPDYLPQLNSLKYHNKDEPLKVPSLLCRLKKLMPDFEICGLQWKYGLYVHCKKRK